MALSKSKPTRSGNPAAKANDMRKSPSIKTTTKQVQTPKMPTTTYPQGLVGKKK